MATPDTALAAAATERHGIVTRAQLRCLVMLDGAIERRVDAGLLAPLHRGVYRHAAAPATTEARLVAAVPAPAPARWRPTAARRGSTGCATRRAADPRSSCPAGACPSLGGVIRHCTDTLEAPDVASVRRIPCTSVPRTLLDLGAVVPFEVELATQAEGRRPHSVLCRMALAQRG